MLTTVFEKRIDGHSENFNKELGKKKKKEPVRTEEYNNRNEKYTIRFNGRINEAERIK